MGNEVKCLENMRIWGFVKGYGPFSSRFPGLSSKAAVLQLNSTAYSGCPAVKRAMCWVSMSTAGELTESQLQLEFREIQTPATGPAFHPWGPFPRASGSWHGLGKKHVLWHREGPNSARPRGNLPSRLQLAENWADERRIWLWIWLRVWNNHAANGTAPHQSQVECSPVVTAGELWCGLLSKISPIKVTLFVESSGPSWFSAQLWWDTEQERTGDMAQGLRGCIALPDMAQGLRACTALPEDPILGVSDLPATPAPGVSDCSCLH